MEKNQDSTYNGIKWWEIALFGISATSLFTALFGFGVAAGFSVVFGFDPTMFFENTFDLLSLSWHGFTQLIIHLPSPDEFYWLVFHNNLILYIPIGTVVVIIAIVYLCTKSKKILQVFARCKKKHSEAKESTKRTISYIGVLLLTPIALTLVIWIIFSIIAIIFLTPVVAGYLSAKNYSYEKIVYPEQCGVVYPRTAYIQTIKQHESIQPFEEKSKAQCIKVRSLAKDKPYQSIGRLVNGTNHYVMIYHKSTGITERISLDGMVVSISIEDE